MNQQDLLPYLQELVSEKMNTINLKAIFIKLVVTVVNVVMCKVKAVFQTAES